MNRGGALLHERLRFLVGDEVVADLPLDVFADRHPGEMASGRACRKRVACATRPPHNVAGTEKGITVAANLSISRAWDETREIFRRDGKLISAVALALIVLPQAVAGLIAPAGTGGGAANSGIVQIMMLAVFLLSIWGQLSIVRLALGPSTTVGDAIQHGLRRFPAALGAFVIMILGMGLVLIPIVMIFILALGVDPANLQQGQASGPFGLLVLLMALLIIAISIRFMLVSAVASAENVGPLAILKRSWLLTSGNYWRLLGFIVLLLIAAIALILAASIVGGILARLVSSTVEPFSLSALILALITAAAQGAFSVLAAVMMTRIYTQVAGRGVEASVPSTGD